MTGHELCNSKLSITGAERPPPLASPLHNGSGVREHVLERCWHELGLGSCDVILCCKLRKCLCDRWSASKCLCDRWNPFGKPKTAKK